MQTNTASSMGVYASTQAMYFWQNQLTGLNLFIFK